MDSGSFESGFWSVLYLDSHLIVFSSSVLRSILNLQQQQLRQLSPHEAIPHCDLGYQHYYFHSLTSLGCSEDSRSTLLLFTLVLDRPLLINLMGVKCSLTMLQVANLSLRRKYSPILLLFFQNLVANRLQSIH